MQNSFTGCLIATVSQVENWTTYKRLLGNGLQQLIHQPGNSKQREQIKSEPPVLSVADALADSQCCCRVKLQPSRVAIPTFR